MDMHGHRRCPPTLTRLASDGQSRAPFFRPHTKVTAWLELIRQFMCRFRACPHATATCPYSSFWQTVCHDRAWQHFCFRCFLPHCTGLVVIPRQLPVLPFEKTNRHSRIRDRIEWVPPIQNDWSACCLWLGENEIIIIVSNVIIIIVNAVDNS